MSANFRNILLKPYKSSQTHYKARTCADWGGAEVSCSISGSVGFQQDWSLNSATLQLHRCASTGGGRSSQAAGGQKHHVPLQGLPGLVPCCWSCPWHLQFPRQEVLCFARKTQIPSHPILLKQQSPREDWAPRQTNEKSHPIGFTGYFRLLFIALREKTPEVHLKYQFCQVQAYLKSFHTLQH